MRIFQGVECLELATLTRRPAVDLSFVRSSGVPPTPTTPTSPGGGKSKKANPLEDLINTEKTYVDCLTGIIRVRFDWLTFNQSLDADTCDISRSTESRSSMVSLKLAASRVGFHVPSRRGRLQGQSKPTHGEDRLISTFVIDSSDQWLSRN